MTSEHHHCTSQIETSCVRLVAEPRNNFRAVSAVVHQGGLCGREDKAHRTQVVPRRAAAWPHHGLLGHWRQAKGAGPPSIQPSLIIV